MLISKLLLVIFIRKISFVFIIMLGTWLLWCNFEAFLHCLHHHQMAVNDLVCLVCVCLMFSISCRISSAEGWEKSSSKSESGGVLADMVMTSSGWYDTSIHSGLV